MRKFFRYLLAIMIVVMPLQGTAAMVLPYSGGMAMAQAVQHMQSHDEAMDEMAPAATADEHCAHAATAGTKAKASHVKCNASVNCSIGAAAPPNALAHFPLSPNLPKNRPRARSR